MKIKAVSGTPEVFYALWSHIHTLWGNYNSDITINKFWLLLNLIKSKNTAFLPQTCFSCSLSMAMAATLNPVTSAWNYSCLFSPSPLPLPYILIYIQIKYRSINRIRYTFIIFYLYPYLIRQTVIRQIHLYYVFITIYKVLLNVPPVQHLHPTYHFL